MSRVVRRIRVLLASLVLSTPLLAAGQAIVAPGIDGGGSSLERSGGDRHQLSVGQLGGSAALVDANEQPRLVGGIGGVLVAGSVPEPGMESALPLAILGLAALRRRNLAANRQREENDHEDRP